ncbi:hypothetical protein [Type-D symbiont of Plautia stali]|uniref:hypothetical protein n=1 Tax=Type-D symbiont of Plautia stali TaxID=1560356 RepID=UPI00128E9A0E|nr:hypothetical protein [Type-D symbiont of Plautia stali]
MFISPCDLPGTVSGEGQSMVAPVLKQLADKLRGREFANFDAFRRALWTEVGKEPKLLEQFKLNNRKKLIKR